MGQVPTNQTFYADSVNQFSNFLRLYGRQRVLSLWYRLNLHQTLTIVDEANPDGVLISATGTIGGNPLVVSSCGYDGTVSLDHDDQIILTCGSVEISVISGTAEISYQMGGMTVSGTLMVGPTIIIDPDNFTITTGANPITLLINGVETTIPPNQTMEFDVTQDDTQVIGGKIIPINATNLLLGSVQSFSLM